MIRRVFFTLMLACSFIVSSVASADNKVSPEAAQKLQLAQDALKAKEPEKAIEPLEYLTQSTEIAKADKLQLFPLLIDACLQTNAYDKLVNAARSYLQLDDSKLLVRLQLGQALSIMGRDSEVVATLQDQMQRKTSSHIDPTETEIRLLARSQNRLKNEAGYVDALKLLVTYYPKPTYWADLIGRVQHQYASDKRLTYGFYRLQLATNSLTDVDDIKEAAQIAISLGLPSDALQLLSAPLPENTPANMIADIAKIREQANALVLADDKVYAELKAIKQKSSSDWQQLGDLFSGKKEWEQARQAYIHVLSLGGSKRESEVQIHLGIAEYYAGDVQGAKETWKRMTATDGWFNLASLWGIFAK